MTRDGDPTGGGGLDDRVPFLARLEETDGAALRALGREVLYPPRSTLVHQDEPTAHVLLVLRGWTKVTVAHPNGYQALLALRGPGDIIGESAALTHRPRSATVTALEHVRAVVIEQERFRVFLGSSPEVSLQLLALASDRTRAADRRNLQFASVPVRERLAVLLLDLAHIHGRRTEEGVEVAVPLTKQELAGAVSASREMVQRELKALRDRGVIHTGRRSLVIVRPDVLLRIARGRPPTA
ncbi:Crp/Fnr family transcriptional regulator [Streptomyces xanthophaeus]|uniref:Crp/Fnr family transcriptional regulator n=1 Tax=Streptomyces xanthophaeus TaxID=67385 RepID=UPI002649ADB4|nr:Crp/Fnr family transcriptional regulator [Streptomyces xanthophaeus]WKD33138.1 Crp/Fnr family transcriptional regulator [Streptomyces xanthophaeus]